MELLLSLRPAAVIDLDATFFVQLAIFLIVLVALRFLIFKPMLALLEARRAETEGKEETAKQESLVAEALMVRYRTVMSDAAADGLLARNRRRDAALKAEAEALSKARAESAAWLNQEVAAYRASVDATRKEAAPVVESVASEVVAMLTGRRSPADGEGR